MSIDRRIFLSGTAALAALPSAATAQEQTMYGLIGQFRAQPGQRNALIDILTERHDMPGCLSYVVYKDLQDGDVVWVSEVWRDQAAHQASLSIPSVKDAIGRAMPLIAEFGAHHELEAVGGVGLEG